eukprot:gene12792-15011_t
MNRIMQSFVVGNRLNPNTSLSFLKRGYATRSANAADEVSATTRHSLYVFGAAEHGKLGVIGDNDRMLPTRVTHMPHRVHIRDAGSSWQSSYVLTDKQLLMWGTNKDGQMGLPNQVFKFPTESDMFKTIDIDRVRMGRSFTMILTKQGAILTAGSNEFGQLGIGSDIKGSMTPRVVEGLRGHDIVSIGAGFDHSIAVTKSGHVFGWGYNVEGQIGQKVVEYSRVDVANDGEVGDTSTMIPDTEFPTPTLVPGLETVKIARVVCGYDSTFLISARGNVYAMGNNETGTLGLGDETLGRVTTPAKVQVPEKIKSLSCGATHALLLSVAQVACGGSHSLALTTDGQVYSWGDGEAGKLGHGDEKSSNIPKLVEALDGLKVVHIAAGIDNSFIVVEEDY